MRKGTGTSLDRIYRFVPIPKLGQNKRGIFRYPASVLAPGSALGSVPTVALSSDQAGSRITGKMFSCVKSRGHAGIGEPRKVVYKPTWRHFLATVTGKIQNLMLSSLCLTE